MELMHGWFVVIVIMFYITILDGLDQQLELIIKDRAFNPREWSVYSYPLLSATEEELSRKKYQFHYAI
jgi:hypothetical protein